jgi:hypothetical protein
MAVIEGPIRFNGSIGDVSCYYNSVLKKWIFRKKGGAHKNHIKKSKKFKNVRLNMAEFKACGEWCHLLRMGLFELDDFNWGLYMSGIVQLSKTIQLMDPIGNWGMRNIESSKYKEMLTDIVFNAQHPFNKVVMRRPEVIADELRMSVTVNLTQFYPLRELIWRNKYDSYRFAMTIAQLSDYVYDPLSKKYAPKHAGLENSRVVVFSKWYGKGPMPEDISLSAAFPPGQVPPADATVMVGLGVEFATNPSGHSLYSAKGDRTMKLVDCL